MKTLELIGADLDYWVAQAEGIPAKQLEIRQVQRPDPKTPNAICVHIPIVIPGCMSKPQSRLDYSTNWKIGGLLIEKWRMDLEYPNEQFSLWWASTYNQEKGIRFYGSGDTALIAICRSIVHSKFGRNVEYLPC